MDDMVLALVRPPYPCKRSLGRVHTCLLSEVLPNTCCIRFLHVTSRLYAFIRNLTLLGRYHDGKTHG